MVLSLGEIILRLNTVSNQKLEQASQFDAYWGGSEANVLINLSLLNNQCRFLTKLPDSPLGTAVHHTLNRFRIDTSFISQGGKRIGIYYMEHGSSVRPGKIIYDREGASVNDLTPDEVDWESLFDQVKWVHWSGITPALSANTAALTERMVTEASGRNLPVSCDLHYRSSLWNYGKSPGDIIPGLLDKTTLLVGDPYAIMQMTGSGAKPKQFLSDDDLFASFSRIMEQFRELRAIAMLSRQVDSATDNTLHGVMYDGNPYRSQDYRINPVTDRIGGGDAFMSGIIDGFIKGQSPKDTIANAAAIAAYKHTVPGDHLEGGPGDFRDFAKDGKGELKR